MKILLKTLNDLQAAKRWDIDFHLPPEGIKMFPQKLLKRVDAVADIVKGKRDPGKDPDSLFQYIDIAAIDVGVGVITNPQDLVGSEAPSRARKVVSSFDILVSTCRPTRGGIAVVPTALHNQIASTAFSVVRAHDDVNPFYLHYALRLPSTLEQFRKWSTGSSYPAILDSDVEKTLIPIPEPEIQDEIAEKVVAGLQERAEAISIANKQWKHTLNNITAALSGAEKEDDNDVVLDAAPFEFFSIQDIKSALEGLPAITVDN